MSLDLVVVGCGGHGREIAQLVAAVNDGVTRPPWRFVGFVDDNPSERNRKLAEAGGTPYLGTLAALGGLSPQTHVVLGLGDPGVRRAVGARVDALGRPAASLVHPDATVEQMVLFYCSLVPLRIALAVTRKACARLVMAQERLYLAALTAARTYSIAGGILKLKGKAGNALSTFGLQPQSLAGTRWVVVNYNNGKQAVVSVLAGTKLTADFDTAGHMAGFAGCNDYSGPVKATPPKISIGPLASTRKFCSAPTGVMEQESAYLAALASAATCWMEGATLEFRTAGGAIAASFTRSVETFDSGGDGSFFRGC